MRLWLLLGALNGLLAVAMGAAGAHAAADPGAIVWIEKAARYQMYHALAIVVVALLVDRRPSPLLHLSAAVFVLGVILFSGSLYAMAFAGAATTLVTPAGGLALMLGWLLLALSAFGRRR